MRTGKVAVAAALIFIYLGYLLGKQHRSTNSEIAPSAPDRSRPMGSQDTNPALDPAARASGAVAFTSSGGIRLPGWLRPTGLLIVMAVLAIWGYLDLRSIAITEPELSDQAEVVAYPTNGVGLEWLDSLIWSGTLDEDGHYGVDLRFGWSDEHGSSDRSPQGRSPVYLVGPASLRAAVSRCHGIHEVTGLPSYLHAWAQEDDPFDRLQEADRVYLEATSDECRLEDGFSATQSLTTAVMKMPELEVRWRSDFAPYYDGSFWLAAGTDLPVGWVVQHQRIAGLGYLWESPIGHPWVPYWRGISIPDGSPSAPFTRSWRLGPMYLQISTPLRQQGSDTALFRAGVLAGLVGGALLLLYEWLPWSRRKREPRNSSSGRLGL